MEKNYEILFGAQFSKAAISLIREAKKSVCVAVFDWRWYSDDIANPMQLLNRALVDAVRRSVPVRALTNCRSVVPILNNVGIKAKKCQTKNLFHPKFMIIDEKILVIGSHNFTLSALTKNHEVSMIFRDFPDINLFMSFFENLYNL